MAQRARARARSLLQKEIEHTSLGAPLDVVSTGGYHHLDQSLSSSKKNMNSLTWVLMAFDSVFYLLSHLP